VGQSLRHARISRWTLRLWMHKDPAFTTCYEEALSDFRGMVECEVLRILFRAKEDSTRLQAAKVLFEKADRAAARLDGIGTALPMQQLVEQLAWAERALDDFVPPVAEDGTPSVN
jgi:hypothetical protein